MTRCPYDGQFFTVVPGWQPGLHCPICSGVTHHIMMPDAPLPKSDIRVYFDMDGVMADFDGHYCAVIGDYTPAPYRDTDWEAVNQHPSFFLDLPVMPGIQALWDMVPAEQRWILSAKARRAVTTSEEQKREWLKRYFQIEGERVIIVLGRVVKVQHCRPGDVLIDDRSDNIEEWIAAGGIGILFTSVPQAIEELSRVMASAQHETTLPKL